MYARLSRLFLVVFVFVALAVPAVAQDVTRPDAVANLLADLCYAWLDPRISYR